MQIRSLKTLYIELATDHIILYFSIFDLFRNLRISDFPIYFVSQKYRYPENLWIFTNVNIYLRIFHPLCLIQENQEKTIPI